MVKKPLAIKLKAPLLRVVPKKIKPKVYYNVKPTVPLQRQLFVLAPSVLLISKVLFVPVKPFVPRLQKISLS